MKNINKTILFASLIAALILPFSGMMMAEAAPNENANDKAKDRFNYKVDVLEKTKLSEEVLNGIKVTHFKQKVMQADFPTVSEFKEANADYFEFLESEFGTEGKKQTAEIISEYAKNRPTGPQVYELDTVKYGDHSISFQPVTKEWPWGSSAEKDPINIVFEGNGNQGDAYDVVDDHASHGWKYAQGAPQWVWVDETSHGGIAYWSFSGNQLEEGDYDGTRYHLRIFNGGDDSHGQFDKWSIGAVHKETWNGSSHDLVSNTWEISESHLKSDLTGATGVVGIGSMWLANNGYFQGEWNGGAARLVELS